MVIKSIQLENFRQYKGRQNKIVFSTDSEKNVTVVLGVNTSGKTTLIQAFKWCLYGKDAITFKTKDLLNIEVSETLAMNQNAFVSVEVALVHEQRTYTIRRSQEFTKVSETNLRKGSETLEMQYKLESGAQEIVEEKEIHTIMNRILPENLSDYFFFDGEKISEINSKKNVKEAVHNLMGLDVVESTKKDLEKVSDKFMKEIDTGEDDVKLKNDLEKYQQELETLQCKRKALVKEIAYYENRIEEKAVEISENKVEKANQERKKDLEKAVDRAKERIQQTQANLLREFTKEDVAFFSVPVIHKVFVVIKKAEKHDAGIPDMRTGAIDFILKRGHCICGLDISSNADYKRNIMHERSLLPPEQVGTSLRNLEEKMEGCLKKAPRYRADIHREYTNYRKNIKDEAEDKAKLEEVSKQILGNKDVAHLEREYQESKDMCAKRRDDKDVVERQIGSQKSEIQKLQKEIDSRAIASKKNKKIKECQRYAEHLRSVFEDIFRKRELEIKEKLSKSINQTFKKIYHGNRELVMDEKYQIILNADVEGKKINTDESKGLETVKNFSFICGLVDVAREKISDSATNVNAIDIVTEAYPLVMDAPFSNADEKHIAKISEVIPEVAEQVILMVMQKDWEYAKTTLSNKIGVLYHITKVDNVDTYSVVEEEAK